LTKDFKPSESSEKSSHGYLYYTAVEEAQQTMYEYLIQRDNVSQQELKNNDTVKAYKELAAKELSDGGYTVTTTINKNIHTAMQNAVANYGGILDDGTGAVEVGNVLLDNKTGAVIGFVGGRCDIIFPVIRHINGFLTNSNDICHMSQRAINDLNIDIIFIGER